MPSYKPVFPQLIDASQVDTGLGAAPDRHDHGRKPHRDGEIDRRHAAGGV